MATPEEKRLKKELRAKWETRQEQQNKQRQLKEKLQSQQFWREYDKKRGVAPERPLAKLAAVEQNKEVNVTQIKENFNEKLMSGAPVNAGGAAGAVQQQQQEQKQQGGNVSPQRKPLFGGILTSAGLAIGSDALSTVGDPWLYIFLGGLFKFIFEAYSGQLPLPTELMFQLFFLAITVILGFKLRGLLGVSVFLLWYWRGIDQTFMIGALVALIFWTILFGTQNLGGEPVYGGIAFAIFYLDLGVVALLVEKFNLPLTQTMQNLLFYTPWWALFGAMMSKSESMIMKMLKFGTVLYVMSLFVIAAVPNVGYEQILPGVGDIARAQERLQAQMPKGENPFISQLKCIGGGQFTNMQECVVNRQAESKCETIKKKSGEQSNEYKNCIAEVKGLTPPVEIAGAVDPTQREPTRVEIQKGEGFLDFIEPSDAVPILVSVKNPRKQKLAVSIGCTFEQGTVSVPSEIIPLTFENTEEQKPIVCRPLQRLNAGSVHVKAEALIAGLATDVWLERFFMGEHKDFDDEIKRGWFPTTDAARPKGPPDYVRLDFEVGKPPSEPLIRTEDPQIWATITNNGGGELVAIHDAFVGPAVEIDVVQSQGCNLQRADDAFTNPSFDLAGRGKEKALRYGLCELQVNDNLRMPPFPVSYLFRSRITYDYKITQEFSLTVRQQPGQGSATSVGVDK